MSENYFTGEVKNTQQQQPTAHHTQLSTSINSETTSKQPQSVTPNNETNHSTNQQQKIQSVNLEEVIAQQQEIQLQKFIQNNPTIAAEKKQLGNQMYTSGKYTEALSFYRKALQYTEKQSQEDKNLRSIIYSNIGLTFMKMRHDESAIQYFKNSLKLNQKYTKARSNLAQCYQNTDKIEEALDEYKKVLEINPNDAYVRQKIVPLQIKVKQLQQKRQQEVMSGLKNIGNSLLGYFGMSLDNFKLQKGPGGGYNVQFKQ